MRICVFLILCISPSAIGEIQNVTSSPAPDVKSTRKGKFHEQSLAALLLKDYIPWARPCNNASAHIDVGLKFSLMQINSLDEKSQVLTTTGWLTVNWHDDLLSWRPEDFGNIKTLEIPGNLIWVPIFGLDNHARMLYDPTFRSEFFVKADYNGKMTWDVGNQFISSCTLDLLYYPWDYQVCVLSFQSYSHTAAKMMLTSQAHEVNLEDFTPNGEWNITETRACDYLALYDVSSREGFWTVHFELYLHRKPKFYVTHVITPIFVLSILVFIVFWLPPEAGEKVSLAMTILLSFSVFLLMIAENMPKTGDSVPLLAIYLASFMAASAISIILSVWIIRSYYHDRHARSRTTGRLGRFIIRKFAFLIDTDSKIVETVLVANRETDERASSRTKNAQSPGHFSVSESMPMVDATPMLNEGVSDAGIGDLDDDRAFSKNYAKCFNQMAADIRSMNQTVTNLKRSYEQQQNRKSFEENCTNEWRLFARVADRLILLLHIACFSVAVIYGFFVFFNAPKNFEGAKCQSEFFQHHEFENIH